MEMDYKISIIGSNSYIARNLIYLLRDTSIKLKLYDYQEKSVDGYENYEQIDINNQETLEKIDFYSDLIYVFSGITGTVDGFEKYNQFIDINEKGLLTLLDIMVKKKSKSKLVFPSTRLVYKEKKSKALKEDDEKDFKTIYALNKFNCENYLKIYKEIFGISYCIARICIPYGNMIDQVGSYGTLEIFVSRAKQGKELSIYGDGLQRRSFIHIYDLCSILLGVGYSIETNGEIYNVGGPDNLSIKEVAGKIAEVYSVQTVHCEWPEIYKKIESGDTVFDSSKVERLLNYKYKYSFNTWLQNLKNK